jgi:hypothetical protein
MSFDLGTVVHDKRRKGGILERFTLPADEMHGAHVIFGTRDVGSDALAAVLVEEWVINEMNVVAVDTTGSAMDFVIPFLPTELSKKARKAKESASTMILDTFRPVAWILGTPVEVTGIPAVKIGLPLLEILYDLLSVRDEQATRFEAELATSPGELASGVIRDLVATAFGKDFEKFEAESSAFVQLINMALANALSNGIPCPTWKELKPMLLDATLLSSQAATPALSEDQVTNFVATLEFYIVHAMLFKGPSFAAVMSKDAPFDRNMDILYLQDLSTREQQLAFSLLATQHALATIAGFDKHVTPLGRLVDSPAITLAWLPGELGKGALGTWLLASTLATGGSLLSLVRDPKADVPAQLATAMKSCVGSSGCNLNLFAGAFKGRDGIAGVVEATKLFPVHVDTAALESVKQGQFLHVHGNDANVLFETKDPGFSLVDISPANIKLLLQQAVLVKVSSSGIQPRQPQTTVQETVQKAERPIDTRVEVPAKNIEERPAGGPPQPFTNEEQVEETSVPATVEAESLPFPDLVPGNDAEAPAHVTAIPHPPPVSNFAESWPESEATEDQGAPDEAFAERAPRVLPEIVEPEAARKPSPDLVIEPKPGPVRIVPDLVKGELASLIAEEADQAGEQDERGGEAFLDNLVSGDVPKVQSRKEGDTPFDFRFVLNTLLHRMETVIRKPYGLDFLKELMDEKVMAFEPALSTYYQETTAILKNGLAIHDGNNLIYRGLGMALKNIITDLGLEGIDIPPDEQLDKLERHLRKTLDLSKKQIIARIEDLDMGQYFD